MRKFVVMFVLLAMGLAFVPGSAGAAQIKVRNCKPVEVAVFSNRIHVKCAVIQGQAYTGDIPYYAMKNSTTDLRVLQTLQLLISAKERGKTLRIWADMADYKSVPGCKGSDCRRLSAVALR